MSTFGERLKELRKEHRLTQQELADNFYLNKSSISRYEKNQQLPENDLLQKIADFFNVSIDYLLGRTDLLKSDTKIIKNTQWEPKLTSKDKIDIEKEAKKMIENMDKANVVEFCGNVADEEDKEYLRLAYEKFLTDVRIYNKQKYTPKKYKQNDKEN
ncbi:helix-turn-helix domain-containing protein [Clostridium senegalense]|uniref:helix-turn-helix domain-containing protein n=1 Tax=Clostridium senegalense TaxID=1465809 RepID=UPI001C1042B8|nr:helix-turn-helix transcriptional regulator [Clostridium senegalense]MBU5227803.1 helix-turn-helix domain-containing protein [Clostridium senegalense]